MHFQMNFKDGISLKCSALCSNKKKVYAKLHFGWISLISFIVKQQ